MRKKINYQRTKQNSNRQIRNNITPLPSPAILESYEEISPGFSKKLLELIEKEQSNNRELQKELIQNNKLTVRVAHISALTFSLFLLLLSFFILLFTKSYVGPAIVVGSWLVFLYIMNRERI